MLPHDSKAERAVRDRAYALAESGRFAAVREVESALIGEGWPHAGRVMQSGYVRRAVEERCRAAHETAH